MLAEPLDLHEPAARSAVMAACQFSVVGQPAGTSRAEVIGTQSADTPINLL